MKCPHCLNAFHDEWEEKHINKDNKYTWRIRFCICPTSSCEKSIIELGKQTAFACTWSACYPSGISRSPIPSEVNDEKLISDYKEACNTLNISAQASAALSRRCLQHILREKAHVKHQNLDKEIDEVIDSNKLPSDLGNNLDCVRSIGNFATHPIKSTNTGEIIDVEIGEAEWNLDVVEELMDFYFVRPARIKNKKDTLNLKLKDAGKPELE